MSKFYSHDIAASRAQRSHWTDLAETQAAIPVLAEFAILHLVDVSERGLADCYDDFNDFLCDFWPDFSWNPEACQAEVTAVLADSRFQCIIPNLNAEWGIDIVSILKEAWTV